MQAKCTLSIAKNNTPLHQSFIQFVRRDLARCIWHPPSATLNNGGIQSIHPYSWSFFQLGLCASQQLPTQSVPAFRLALLVCSDRILQYDPLIVCLS